ncbi:MAG: AAA family ATPase [Thermodesulfobacteriota bacterium]|nr:AAA family ATPase [Thermodesulfobacteriota bacterium]
MENEKKPTDEKQDSGRTPNQKELEKELKQYLYKRYGDRVRIVSPFVFPRKEESPGDDANAGAEDGPMHTFDMLPEELEAYLESFIVKQENAKAVLATKICTHFNRIKFNGVDHSKRPAAKKKASTVGMIKNNVLMIGPTGVGKTYIIKLIAQKLGVPFVKGDATKFSETGYVGGDVEDLVRDLVYEANEDIGLAENGIIYIDEIDKICSTSNLIGHDVSRTGVQRALLKPMEETEVDLKVAHDPISQIQAIEHYRRTGKKEKRVVNTKNILFIMSGAFGDLAQIIRKRLQSQGLGFEADVRSTEVPWEILREVSAQDLIEFGFESEFVGRMPVIVVFDELTEDDLYVILKNPNNPIIISKRLDFRAYGIEIKFEEEALMKIAKIAATEKTGARGLVSAIEKALIPFEKRLPSKGVKRFLVTPEVVNDPDGRLDTFLEHPDDPVMEKRFQKAADKELKNIKEYISKRLSDFCEKSGLDIYERRMDVIAESYLRGFSDINRAFDDFMEMYSEIRNQESSLVEEIGMDISFDESAVDEIISQAVKTGQKAGSLVIELATRLEYGLRLVEEKTGIESFTISSEAITDTENFINGFVKKCYHEENTETYLA